MWVAISRVFGQTDLAQQRCHGIAPICGGADVQRVHAFEQNIRDAHARIE